jgi:peptidoglycan hydrolase-like protein with peptidoglycan-binding domain
MRRIIGRPTASAVGLAVLLAACGGVAAPATTVADPSVTTVSTEAVIADSTTSTSTSTSTSTTLPPSGPPLAVQGDTNETVEAFQYLLNCNGHGDLTLDGAFGPATLAAVEAAQTTLGRAVNGEPDAELMADLSRSCSENRRLPGDGDGVITVFGNAAPGDPEVFSVALLKGSTLSVTVTLGLGHLVTVRGADGSEIPPAGETTWEIAGTQDYLIEVTSPSGPVMFALAVKVTPGVQETGDWILATDSITYRGTKLSLGDDAQTVIDAVIGFLGHGIRGSYLEFDTDWYTITDPQDLGLRGVFIEGFALLFFGPDPVHPAEPETFERWRFEGPSDDAAGVARPDDYATTGEGITVGDTLVDLVAAYGSDVTAGSNSEEHYFRFSDSGGEMCFYFGAAAPTNSSTIIEIASECRG